MSDSPGGELGVVLTGGGARAAYQVGTLRAISRACPTFRIPIVTAVSAGAINAAVLLSREEALPEALDRLRDLWSGLSIGDVFAVDAGSLSRNVIGWGARLLSGGAHVGPRVRGLVDTTPLAELLRRNICSDGDRVANIEEKINRGELKALAISTLNYATGQTITWVQGRNIAHWERPMRRSRQAHLTLPHVLASASLPLLFPAVPVGDSWYGDGGVRLSAPLSPALHLGAGKILAITTQYRSTFEEADRPMSIGYPPPVQVAGHLLNAIFLDLIDQDALRMQRFNELLDRIPRRSRGSMRKVDLMVLRPSLDLGQLAAGYEAKFPRSVRYLLRGLGTGETSSTDFLSFLLFDSAYVTALMDLGEKDAEDRMDEILAFLGEPGEPERAIS